jgi:Spx/MgsR family transcriptional regulator
MAHHRQDWLTIHELAHGAALIRSGRFPFPKPVAPRRDARKTRKRPLQDGDFMILYGIPTCDTCKKAQKALEAAGHAVTFRDIRRDPLTAGEIARLVDAFGDRLINKTSTTYRSFNPFLRESDAEVQLAEAPTVMKRPVIEADGALYLGWDSDVQAALLKG